MTLWAVPARIDPIVTTDGCTGLAPRETSVWIAVMRRLVNHHRVHRLVRTGTVPALPADADGETVGMRRNRARRHHDLAEPIMVCDVAGEDRLDLIKRVGLQDRTGSVPAFFGWLKDEQHGAVRRLSL